MAIEAYNSTLQNRDVSLDRVAASSRREQLMEGRKADDAKADDPSRSGETKINRMIVHEGMEYDLSAPKGSYVDILV